METAMNDSVRRAGWFEVTGVRPITLAGKRRNAIFADLHFTDQWAAEEAMQAQLPYRSIEIFNITKPPSIDGLALLEHEAPFLRLPMLMPSVVDDQTTEGGVAGATFADSWSMDARQNDYGVVACLRQGKKATLLFRHENKPMTKKMTPKPEDVAAEKAKQAALFAEHSDDDKDKDKNLEEGEGEGEGIDWGAVAKAIASGTVMQKDLDAVLEAIQQQGGEKEPAEVQVAPAAVPGGEAMAAKAGGSLLEKLVGLAAENVKMRADITAIEGATSRGKNVAVALKRLEGRALGDPAVLEAELNEFHDLGPKAFKMYVDRLAKNNGVLPDEKDDADGTTLKGASELALTFSDKGKAAVEYATGLEKQHEWMTKNTRTDVTLKECVEIGMEKWIAAQKSA
jgi:hypothetical protein